MLRSNPSGRQYSARRNTIAIVEINILIRLARLAVIKSLIFRSDTIPKAIKIKPNQEP